MAVRVQEEDPLDRHKGTGRNRKKHDRALHSFAKAAKSSGDDSLYVLAVKTSSIMHDS